MATGYHFPRLRIISEGFGRDTRFLLDDGTDITRYVRSVKWELEGGGGAARVTLEFLPCSADVIGEITSASIVPVNRGRREPTAEESAIP